MKAPSAGYRIVRLPGTHARGNWWSILDDQESNAAKKVKGYWKTARGARTAHYRLAVARLTGKPVSYAQARRAGNA